MLGELAAGLAWAGELGAELKVGVRRRALSPGMRGRDASMYR